MRSVCAGVVRKGINEIFLTTDADDNNRVRGFYAAMGWDLLGYYVTLKKRKMCWYLWENPEKEKKQSFLHYELMAVRNI